MTPERPVLRYFGGKWRIAPWIISHFPPHRIYVEPFGGAASVLMRKPRTYAEVYNDLDGGIVEVFRVLRDPVAAAELERRLRMTPFARDEFNEAYEPTDDPIEHARRMMIRSFMGFGSGGHNPEKGRTGFRACSNRSGTTPAHDWANFAACIPTFTERLRGVVIENRDASEVMQQHDTPETLHFVDPPYVHSTRTLKHGYQHEMTDEQHEQLCEVLANLQGMVILCGYANPIYERIGWTHTTHATHADGARDRTEYLWLNPACVAAQSQMSLFKEVPRTGEEEVGV